MSRKEKFKYVTVHFPQFFDFRREKVLGWVVQKVDNAILRVNHCPADSVVCCVNTYPLDSDLSDG